jgi:trk system potassium uptake protein TrkH
MDCRPILRCNGFILMGLSLAMLITGSIYSNHAFPFFLSTAITAFVGGALILMNRPMGELDLNLGQILILALFSWGLMALFSALPFYLSVPAMSYPLSVFEAISGLTTTGITCIQDISNLTPPVILWRSLLQIFGSWVFLGYGIAVAYYFKWDFVTRFWTHEHYAPSDHFKALFLAIALQISVCLLVFMVLTYKNLPSLEALCYAVGLVSAGGFAPLSSSIALFSDPWIAAVSIVAMGLGAMGWVALIGWIMFKQKDFFSQWRLYGLAVILSSCILVLYWAMWLWPFFDLQTLFLNALFFSVSVTSSTGYFPFELLNQTSFITLMCLGLIAVGGCSGSASGGLKMVRLQVSGRIIGAFFKRFIAPRTVFSIRYGENRLNEFSLISFFSFIAIGLIAFFILAFLLVGMGYGLSQALLMAGGVLTNTNYTSLPLDPYTQPWVYGLLALGMFIGRIEIVPIFILTMLLLSKDWTIAFKK